MALIARHDAVIPPPHAYTLLKHWKGESSFLEVNADHISILDDESVWKKMGEFTENHIR